MLILRRVDLPRLGFVLARLNVAWAVQASVLTFLLITLLAARWLIFLRRQNIALPFKDVLALTWGGQFFNSVLPGSTGGDLIKIYQVCRLTPNRKAAATSTVFVDRLSALISLVLLSGCALVADTRPLAVIWRPEWRIPLLLAIFIILSSAGLAAGWLILRLVRGTTIYGRIRRTLTEAKANLVLNRRLAVAVVLAFGVHLVNFTTVYLFARALRIPLSYAQVLRMMPVVLLVMLIPITINGHGLREVLLIAYLQQFGVMIPGEPALGVQEIAVALSLLLVANDLLWTLPGGIWYLLKIRTSDDSPDQARRRNE